MKSGRFKPVKIINFFFPFFLFAVIGIIGVAVTTYSFFVKDLKAEELIVNRRDTGLTLLDSSGEPFFRFYDARTKEVIPLEDMPQSIQDAVVASEDKRFYEHRGFSIFGIARAALANIQAQDIEQGGSTITQQLAKNAFLSSKKSYLRKYQELILAEEIEERYSKQDILEMYLNSVYFGGGAFGVEKAADVYFGKEASELTLAESALLVGLLPAPSVLSPLTGDAEEAMERKNDVLRAMRDQGFITHDQYLEAREEPIRFQKDQYDVNRIAPHFAIYIRNLLIEQYGESFVANSGMVVQTTLNRDLQKFAQNQVSEHVERLKNQNVSNGAAVVIDAETHAIEAMVGSVEWSDPEFGKVNVAVRPRQPGSSFKPYVYAQALESRDITLSSILHDKPTQFERNYTPQNYDRRYRGNVTVRRALANSLNIPAVELLTEIGVEEGIMSAKRFGITTMREADSYGPSLVLGTAEVTLLEHTNGYATFASEGRYAPAYAIVEIRDRYGDLMYKHRATTRQVISPGTAYLISSALSDASARRETFGSSLDTSVQAAVKTGTTDDYKDSWTVGYTPDTAVGVWVGNNDNEPMAQIAGSLGAAPIWRALIEYTADEDPEDTSFSVPSTVSLSRVCPNGSRVPPQAPVGFGRTEFFLEGTAPTTFCTYRPPQPDDSPQTPTNDQTPTSPPSTPPTSDDQVVANE